VALALGLIAVAGASVVLLLRGEDASPTAIPVQQMAGVGRAPAGRDAAPEPASPAPAAADNPANAVVARAWEALMPAGTRPVRTVATESAPRTIPSQPADIAAPLAGTPQVTRPLVATPRVTRTQPADSAAPLAPRVTGIQAADSAATLAPPRVTRTQPADSAGRLVAPPRVTGIQPADSAAPLAPTPGVTGTQPADSAATLAAPPRVTDSAATLAAPPRVTGIQPADSAATLAAPPRVTGIQPADSAATLAAPPRVTRPQPAEPTARTAALGPVAAPPSPAPRPPTLPSEAITQLVAFDTAPFPYDGRPPGSNARFLNVIRNGHRGHRTRSGHVYWEEAYSDRRVLLHVPPGFDPRQPGVIVVFFHGHGATLARDVRDRQQVPAQISASGLNAVLVAPQFAVDAADSSAGQFWEPGAFKRFIAEAGSKLARLTGDPRAEQAFAAMPVVIVGYSGGFLPTAYALRRGGLEDRVRGVVLLDGLYAEFDTFANWIANNRSSFFVSAYTPHTSGHNVELEHMLKNRGVPFATSIKAVQSGGGVAFIATGSVSHRDFVTHAWTDRPLEDLLGRLAEYRAKSAPPIASLRLCGDACR
jgi:hypothetical protein